MDSPTIRPANFTRHTPDLAGKLRSERRYGFLALYHLMRLSDLGREGIERSGSYRFADHLYANRASGRGWIGRLIDRVLLSLPAARAMRQRCGESTAAMQRAFAAHHTTVPFRILTVPCGLPRDVRDFADRLHCEDPTAVQRIEYTGMDLDPEVIAAARTFLAGSHMPSQQWVQGDALDAASFPQGRFHFIASTGLGEFLDDAQLATFTPIFTASSRPAAPSLPARQRANRAAMQSCAPLNCTPTTARAQKSSDRSSNHLGARWAALTTRRACRPLSVR